ncbi:hypothetical protein M430DRAFT_133506 [Amorphotheca resinae ATCC 22711]|uniref:Heterokaryon incompatibility domain-containing protein n=1 Tax=Amorphotheca resinae ATCC 22711 TaxID=857342 RepID=A0A2T3BAB3_AMORE|nr:hypothetical protein M430DRAFT_133506 [Amorphotheca resinae ATCC 22711]PSS25238.1 hypothetical protein M430DRAFT_133506 [Amorphotheca resinae ATCC 22711]
MAYPYQKLRDNDIRVLYLAPGKSSDPIRCGLITLSLANNPRYEALSYAWGVIDSYNLITVDGCPMRIRENLETALRHLRYEQRDRILWVDALCINQEDDEERSQQVSYMSLIYSKAMSTVIYLGDRDSDTDRAFDALEMFSQDRHLPDLPIWKADDPGRIEWAGVLVIERILLFPWWGRTWIIQEVALARNLVMVCGKRSLNWDSVVTPAVHSMVKHVNSCCMGCVAQKDYQRANRRLKSPLYQLMQNLDTIRRSIQRGSAPALLQLLKNYRDREATDPRDKVYALLGIAGDVSLYAIIPDYQIPFEEVYKATALQLILMYRSLEVLNLTLGLSKSSDLPSWTPDWRVSPTDSKKVAMHCSHERNLGGYRACGRMPFFVFRREANFLCVNGIYFDDIAELSDVLDTEQETALNETLALWEEKIVHRQRIERSYVGGGDWLGAYFRTMAADLIMVLRSELSKDEIPVDVIPMARDVFQAFRLKTGLTMKLVTSPEITTDPDIVQIPDEEQMNRLMALKMAFQNRRLFITKRGYLGTVPEETQLGDTVHILCAAKTPMILRLGPVTFMGRSANGHQVVGDAYVHGIMNGEACNGTRPPRPHLIY